MSMPAILLAAAANRTAPAPSFFAPPGGERIHYLFSGMSATASAIAAHKARAMTRRQAGTPRPPASKAKMAASRIGS